MLGALTAESLPQRCRTGAALQALLLTPCQGVFATFLDIDPSVRIGIGFGVQNPLTAAPVSTSALADYTPRMLSYCGKS